MTIEYLERLPTRHEHERWLVSFDGVTAEAHVYLDAEPWEFFAERISILGGITHPHLSPVLEIGGTRARRHVITGDERGESIAASSRAALCEGIAGVADALAMLDARWGGYVARQISPDELFIGADGVMRLRVPLWQLPHARAAHQPDRQVFAWLAPEQARGLRLDSKTDVHALALLVYVFTTGIQPYLRDGDFDTLLAVRDVVPLRATNVPAALADLLDEALMRDPARRPDLRSFAERLRHTGRS